MQALAEGKVQHTPQRHEDATKAPPLTKEMALFDFTAPAAVLHNKIRGLYPWPVAQFEAGGVRIKVNHAEITAGEGRPGEVLSVKPLIVACAQGALRLTEVVPQGKRPMTGQEWAAGRRLKPGDNICP
ncbi:Methionyl-tRNA formyltransferase [bioreactor metagenome]|uniref:Methionyl-tRNA formyltransferase n=1 Tax=bioreactor metagenome TaxID=1076179 RepID=A0A645IQA3_9ZZZZ